MAIIAALEHERWKISGSGGALKYSRIYVGAAGAA